MKLTFPHPGALLRQEFLDPIGITPYRLAKDIGVPLTRITAILAATRRVTAETAILRGERFGTSAEFWLNLQTAYDLRVASKEVGRTIAKLPTRPDKRAA